MFAALYGNEPLVRALLKNGATPDVEPSFERGALASAALAGHHGIVELLLKAGADPRVRDFIARRLPEDYAAEGGHGKIAARLRRRRLEMEGHRAAEQLRSHGSGGPA